MKYAIVQCVNGNFSIVSEYTDNLEGAIVRFHQVCANLWNAQDVRTAQVKLVNEYLEVVMGKSENIGHDEQIEEAPAETPAE